jgi:hypothetical protein
MEAREEELIRTLIDGNPELRKFYEEHVALERRLAELREKPRLSAEEEIEKKRIQKKKLAGKDRIMEILANHRQRENMR